MHTFAMSRHWRAGILLASLVLVALLQGCHRGFVEVSVNVQTACPPSDGGEPPGACNRITIVNPWITDGETLNALTGNPIGAGKQCISGKRCKTPLSSAGNCTLGGPNCRTFYWPTADANKGTCKCECPGAYP